MKRKALLFMILISIIWTGCAREEIAQVVPFVKPAQKEKLPPGSLELSITDENGAPLNAHIEIKSPEDEEVLFDGRSETGRLKFSDITPGEYILKVTKKEFQPIEKHIFISSNRTTRIKLSLISAIGNLKIWVVDSHGNLINGARVNVGGVYQITKKGIANFTLLSGTYTVEVSKVGYKTASKKVKVVPKRTTPLSVALEPLPTVIH